MKAKVIDIDSNPVGEIELSDEVFGLEPRKDILARMVNYQLAKRRAGTHRAKERSDVEGSTRKIWKQKGTGRARHGGIRAPQFRGGGKVFGPVVRSHAHDLPKKVRRLALKHALSAKAKEAKLVVLADTQIAEAKTSGLVKRLQKLGWANALIIDGATVNQNFQRAAANIPNIDVLPTQGCNVYDILRRDVLVLTKGAAEALQARLK